MGHLRHALFAVAVLDGVVVVARLVLWFAKTYSIMETREYLSNIKYQHLSGNMIKCIHLTGNEFTTHDSIDE
jgi:hypothetical protein